MLFVLVKFVIKKKEKVTKLNLNEKLKDCKFIA